MNRKQSFLYSTIAATSLFLLAFIYSCNKHQTSAIQSSALEKVALTPVENHYVSLEQATSVAKLNSMFTKVRGSGDGIHAASQLAIARTKAAPIATTHTVTVGTGDSAELYVINYADSGFVMISADDRMPPVLAYNTRGSVNLDDTLNKPSGIQDWLSSMRARIRYCRQHNTPQDSTVKGLWKQYELYSSITQSDSGLCYLRQGETNTILPDEDPGTGNSNNGAYSGSCSSGAVAIGGETYYGPLLTTTWDQGNGYNNLLFGSYLGFAPFGTYPKCDPYAITTNSGDSMPVTGCVVTSTAMVMKFWQWPQTYNWSIMPNYADFSTAYTSGAVAIQQLMKDIGKAVIVSYGCGESGANTQNAATALTSTFGYKSATYSGYNAMTVANELQAGYPVLLAGGRHQWVADGVELISQYQCVMAIVDGLGSSQDPSFMWVHSSDIYYFDMNWGWSGYYNGWYLDGNFTITDGITTHNFNSNLVMIYNIRP